MKTGSPHDLPLFLSFYHGRSLSLSHLSWQTHGIMHKSSHTHAVIELAV